MAACSPASLLVFLYQGFALFSGDLKHDRREALSVLASPVVVDCRPRSSELNTRSARKITNGIRGCMRTKYTEPGSAYFKQENLPRRVRNAHPLHSPARCQHCSCCCHCRRRGGLRGRIGPLLKVVCLPPLPFVQSQQLHGSTALALHTCWCAAQCP